MFATNSRENWCYRLYLAVASKWVLRGGDITIISRDKRNRRLRLGSEAAGYQGVPVGTQFCQPGIKVSVSNATIWRSVRENSMPIR